MEIEQVSFLSNQSNLCLLIDKNATNLSNKNGTF